MILYTPPAAAQSIPIVDLSASFGTDAEAKKAVAWEIHRAARDTGFFYVSNHGVSKELTDAQLDCARAFFALPQDVKDAIQVARSATMRGYEPMAIQTLDDGSKPDVKEGFMASVDGSQAYVTGGAYDSLNQWPAAYREMRPQTEAYIEALMALGKHLLGLLALSLELPEDYFAEGLKQPMITTRLLHYPPQSRVGDGNQLGAGAHTDWGMLTMLLQDNVGGLEVRNSAGEWVRAPFVEDTFVVNLGDMVPVLTRGLYHSNMHRVLNSSPERHRYSVATFFDPNYHYRITPLDGLPLENPTPAASRTVGEHIAAMYAQTYG